MADWARQVPNTSNTVFMIPGIGSEFFTAAILRLEDRGKVRDQSPICRYLQPCPHTWSSITVHQVLDYTSGINDTSMNNLQGQAISLPDLIVTLGAAPLSFKPGTTCCDGISRQPIEEAIVDRVAGMPFGAYLQQQFFGPLGLAHTGFFPHDMPVQAHAVGYQSWQQPSSLDSGTYDMSWIGGEIYSTIGDLTHWEQALHAGHLLSAAATARLQTQLFRKQKPEHCLCGMIWDGTSEGYLTGTPGAAHRQVLFIQGYMVWGFDSEVYYPASGLSVLVLSNLADLPSQILVHLDSAMFS